MRSNHLPTSPIQHGTEVIINNANHAQYNEIGVFVGLTHALGEPLARVRIDGSVYLCSVFDLIEN
ncbi:hypothetical protein [Achromobacter sp. Root170]|uniref:hypothetical protein n=1 Tax=Achromobacter sp. Root170 TaxID=1736480 RepID=UPI0006FA3941|nr:hypothetical protein [Achromobacter sp. Root170]KRB11969.1 hypothetical protein ASD87_12180 [Achromobacter sp. Root170]